MLVTILQGSAVLPYCKLRYQIFLKPHFSFILNTLACWYDWSHKNESSHLKFSRLLSFFLVFICLLLMRLTDCFIWKMIFKTLETTDSVTQCHIAEELYLLQLYCEGLKPSNVWILGMVIHQVPVNAKNNVHSKMKCCEMSWTWGTVMSPAWSKGPTWVWCIYRSSRSVVIHVYWNMYHSLQ